MIQKDTGNHVPDGFHYSIQFSLVNIVSADDQ